MSRRRRVLWISALFAAAIALIVLWSTGRTPPVGVTADGRRVTIDKITYGTEHRFTLGKWWVRVLKPVLGTRWAARRGCIETTITNAQPVMMLWTRWSGVSKTNPLPGEATILDTGGTESGLIVARWNQSAWWAYTNRFESSSYVAWMLNNYPRRSDRLRLRIFDRDKQNAKIAATELTFRNPGPRRFPQWTGKGLPVSRTNENVVFTLKDLRQAADGYWNAQFAATTNGVPDPSWQIGGIEASDATGNLVKTRWFTLVGGHMKPNCSWRDALWPSEKAWKLSVEFCSGFDFEAHELWTSRAMTLRSSNSGTLNTINTVASVNGVRVALADPQSTPQTVPWHPNEFRPNATIMAHFDPDRGARPHRLFLVRALDDQNREIKVQLASSTMNGWHNFGLLVPSGAKSLQFTFAVRKSTVIEFDVSSESVLSRTTPP